MRRLLIPIAAATMLLMSCSRTPGYVIPPDRMAEIMADVHTGEAVVDANALAYRADSTKTRLLNAVYAKHGVDAAEVDTSLYWYGHHLKEYMEVYDKTIALLQQRIAEVERAGGKSDKATTLTNLDGDSVNVWTGPAIRRNSAGMPSEFITFALSSDRNWEQGDRYTLSVKPLNTRGPVTLNLAVTYNDGTAEYVVSSSPLDHTQRLTLVLDSTKTANSVFGSLHYAPQRNEVSYLDSITLVRTRGRNDNVRARMGQHTVSQR